MGALTEELIAFLDAARSTLIMGGSSNTKGTVEGRGLVFCSSGLLFTLLLQIALLMQKQKQKQKQSFQSLGMI